MKYWELHKEESKMSKAEIASAFIRLLSSTSWVTTQIREIENEIAVIVSANHKMLIKLLKEEEE